MTNQPSPDSDGFMRDVILHGRAAMKDGKHVPLEDIFIEPTYPDMGQSVSDEMVEAAARGICAHEGAIWDAKNFNETMCGSSPEEQCAGYRDIARAALEAAERLRAPVGGGVGPLWTGPLDIPADTLDTDKKLIQHLLAVAVWAAYSPTMTAQDAALLNRLGHRASDRLQQQLAPVGGDVHTCQQVIAEEFSRQNRAGENEFEGNGTWLEGYYDFGKVAAAMARTRTSVVPDGWRTIETAPKRKSVLILCGHVGENSGEVYKAILIDSNWFISGLTEDSGNPIPEYWMPFAAPTLPIAKGSER